ncbi:hypothetical protein JST97_26555 [bacterium]|nr:hypothetical protein [bacterium]
MAKLNKKELEWLQVRQRYGLSHAQVQMARELELVPRLLLKQEQDSLPEYLEQSYQERFQRAQPLLVLSIEERAKQEQRDNAMQKLAQKQQRGGTGGS